MVRVQDHFSRDMTDLASLDGLLADLGSNEVQHLGFAEISQDDVVLTTKVIAVVRMTAETNS